MYWSQSNGKSDVLTFINGSQYLGLEILVIIYASGAAAFGISVEIYILLPYAIGNCVLIARTCGGSDLATDEITWVVQLAFLLLSVEVCHRNFRKFQMYNENFNSSARAMLKQALLFSVTILLLNSPGLRSLHYGINKNIPRQCAYETSHCGIVNLYEPLFWYDNDSCLGDLTDYVTGREQQRILRDFILLNVISYSVFNRNFLEISRTAKYLLLRIVLILLFIALATSVLVSNIDPLIFVQNCRFAYDIIELIIFTIELGLMLFNLYNLRSRQPHVEQQPTVSTLIVTARTTIPSEQGEIEIMDPSPSILPSK